MEKKSCDSLYIKINTFYTPIKYSLGVLCYSIWYSIRSLSIKNIL